MKYLVLLFITFLLVTPCFGAPSEDAPLQLMPTPGAKGAQQSVPGQMPLQMQGQGQPVELIDIYGVVPTTEPLPYVAIAAGVAALLFLAALLVWWLKSRKRVVKETVVPPWDQALHDLAEARPLQKKAQGRLYMEKASQILRRYIEQRFAIQSTKQTTSEFLRSLAANRSPQLKEYRDELQNCLEQADLSKFAHKSQEEEGIRGVENAVTGFVQATRPIEGAKEGGK